MSRAVRKVKTAGRKVTLKELLKDEKKRVRFFLLASGVLLVLLGYFTSKPAVLPNPVKTQEISASQSFAQEPVSVDQNLLKPQTEKSKNKKPPLRIIMPALGMDVSVREAKVVKGYWEVFGDAAGFGLGSSYPDEVGNQVIFAHAREGLFLPLRNAKLNQQVYVMTKDYWYSYTITNIKDVLPSQLEVIAPTSDSTLTLYTCTGFADSKRLIVIAKKT